MEVVIQSLHLIVFWCLFLEGGKRTLPAIALCASAFIYLIMEVFVWPVTVTPLNTYGFKFLVDGLFAFLLVQIASRFARAQSFLIWMSAGLNLVSYFAYHNSLMIVYNSYATIATVINVLQILVVLPWVEKVVYGAFNPLDRFCRAMDLHLVFFERYGR